MGPADPVSVAGILIDEEMCKTQGYYRLANTRNGRVKING